MDILTQTISLHFPPSTNGDRTIWAGYRPYPAQTAACSAFRRHARRNGDSNMIIKAFALISDFCQRLPLQTYDEIKPYVTRMINGERNILWPSVVRWYAKSSGTTNDKSKFLPVTPEILKGCHYKRRLRLRSQFICGTTRKAVSSPRKA